MDLISVQVKEINKYFPSSSPEEIPYYNSIPPPLSRQPNLDGFNLDSKVSPSILIIIIILAIIFFICGLLHLLVRFLLRPQARDQDEIDSVTALQGQLQQLFHLHDAGVDQSFIDTTLPVFHYKDIIGSKNKNDNNPFDCAVCLCEFEPEDKLRLLPKCSHAFHMECIDTWLLSHSTCPLCRASLIPDISSQNNVDVCSPIVYVLESGSGRSRETDASDGREQQGCSSELDYQGDIELGSSRIEVLTDSGNPRVDSGEKVVAVKLGKFRNVDDHGAEGSNSREESCVTRRCYSMGYFEYVMDENSLLKVPIKNPAAKKPRNLPLNHVQRLAMSECDCESRREFNGFEGFSSMETNPRAVAEIGEANVNSSKRRESYSISKTWLRGKKKMKQSSTDGGTGGGGSSSSRRAFSFRFPMRSSNPEAGIETNFSWFESEPTVNGQEELGNGSCLDEENISNGHGCSSSMDFQTKTPSFARRTLLWLVGRQGKVGNSPCTTADTNC